MSIPLFKVGEEVILQSTELPHLNGEYCVEFIINSPKDVWGCRINPKFNIIYNGNSVGYILSPPVGYVDNQGRFHEVQWGQSALRKKHKGSDLSFSELISNIKNIEAKA